MSIALNPITRNPLPHQSPTKSEQIPDAYPRALATIKATPRWANGHIIDVGNLTIKNRKASIYLKNESGHITLTLYRSGKSLMDRYYSEKFHMASFVPVSGWTVVSTEADYRTWNLQTERALGMSK